MNEINHPTLAPICLFAYSRLNETRLTIEALQQNFLAADSVLFIFSDMAKEEQDKDRVKWVRDDIHTITGFAQVTIIERTEHTGLANSIISGVTRILEEYGKVIVLEDDLITSRNFLDYMNQALDFYAEEKKILSISGYSFPFEYPDNHQEDVSFSLRASSWGWGTWQDRWADIDWEVQDYDSFKWNIFKHLKFNRGGSDLSHMLRRQVTGRIDSWAIRFSYHQYKHNLLDVFPKTSKVLNDGFGPRATHTKKIKRRLATVIDTSEQRTFTFSNNICLDIDIALQFYQRHSLKSRIKDKFYNTVFIPLKFLTVKLMKKLRKSDSIVHPAKTVVFHPSLAPYRVDFFNQFSARFHAKFYFSFDNVVEQKFDQKELRSKLLFPFNLLHGFEINNKPIRFGILHILLQEKPSIVLCSEYSQITIVVLVFKMLIDRKIKVYTISDDSVELSIKREGVRKWVRDKASYFLDGVIFPSQAVGEWYHQNVNSKTKTLELPIVHSNDIFREKLSDALSLSTELIYSYQLIGKKVFLFVGRLVKIKNVHSIVEAFYKAKKNNEILVIIGSGEEYNVLRSLVEDFNLNEIVFFVGKLEGNELMAWYNIAQCFILASTVEPYGAVVNEALLSGCKMICSEYAGAASLVNEINGYLYNPNKINDLVQLIEKVSSEINAIQLPLSVKSDLMPFDLGDKLDTLIKELITQ